ncbi:MAG: glycerophosphodiester phosphodiesterase family protein [Bacteroidales bacterium]|nr:glycerophosphodiester phosphodiesterase family protein [Bacteroidales bacterium]MBQ2331182.1 glycerophosphodiester phosphodiesterase family protein [Bacteroidales bacterium]
MSSCWNAYISCTMRKFGFFLFLALLAVSCKSKQEEKPVEPETYTYSIGSTEELCAFFSLDQDDIIVSGHRGGVLPGYPENCLETMQQMVQKMTTFFEIDPRLTADSVAVLLHDSTLDRTTTGEGLLKEKTYQEIAGLYLKDEKGKPTPYHIPLLDEVLAWSRDKVILHIDQKEIPYKAMSELVHRLNLHNIVFSSQVPSNAQYLVSVDPDVRLIAWMHSMEEFRKFEAVGALDNMVAVWICTDAIDEEHRELSAALRARGIRVMVATAAKRDRNPAAYASGPDIIETDYPVDFIGQYRVRR